MVALPFRADQPANAKLAKERGLAEVLEPKRLGRSDYLHDVYENKTKSTKMLIVLQNCVYIYIYIYKCIYMRRSSGPVSKTLAATLEKCSSICEKMTFSSA